MGPDEIPLQVLSDLRNEVTKLPSVIFEESCQSGEVSDDWRKGNTTSIL